MNLVIGVGQVNVLLRHAQTLKDKRQFTRSVIQKLKNQGFSVTECGYIDDPKRASIGFSFAGRDPSFVRQTLEEGVRHFIGCGEILQSHTDTFDYSAEDRVNGDVDREGEL